MSRKLGHRGSMIALGLLSAGTLFALAMVSRAKKANLMPPPQPPPGWWPGAGSPSGGKAPADVTQEKGFEASLAALDQRRP